jgi:hypothetical protein
MTALIVASLTLGGWVAIAVCVILLVLSAVPVIWLCWRFVQMSDEAVANAVEDVQRFIDLSEEARREMAAAPRLPLLDSEGTAVAAAAIDRFRTRKELARKALWRAEDAPFASSESSAPATTRPRASKRRLVREVMATEARPTP